MNRQRPPFDAIPAAWASLPADDKARLGCALIEYVFADFVSGESYEAHDQYGTAEIRNEASERRDNALNAMFPAVMDALPDLFGGEHQDPPWAWREIGEYEAEIQEREQEADAQQGAIVALKLAAEAQRQRDASPLNCPTKSDSCR